MKKSIHPKYHPQAKVSCQCGHSFTTGSTQPEIKIDICSHCHPFYTGKSKFVDTEGRIDRFRQKIAQAKKTKTKKKKRKKSKK